MTKTKPKAKAGHFLSPAGAARRLGNLNPQTVRRMIDRGELKAVRLGRLLRVPESELIRLEGAAKFFRSVPIGSRTEEPEATRSYVPIHEEELEEQEEQQPEPEESNRITLAQLKENPTFDRIVKYGQQLVAEDAEFATGTPEDRGHLRSKVRDGFNNQTAKEFGEQLQRHVARVSEYECYSEEFLKKVLQFAKTLQEIPDLKTDKTLLSVE